MRVEGDNCRTLGRTETPPVDWGRLAAHRFHVVEREKHTDGISFGPNPGIVAVSQSPTKQIRADAQDAAHLAGSVAFSNS